MGPQCIWPWRWFVWLEARIDAVGIAGGVLKQSPQFSSQNCFFFLRRATFRNGNCHMKYLSSVLLYRSSLKNFEERRIYTDIMQPSSTPPPVPQLAVQHFQSVPAVLYCFAAAHSEAGRYPPRRPGA